MNNPKTSCAIHANQITKESKDVETIYRGAIGVHRRDDSICRFRLAFRWDGGVWFYTGKHKMKMVMVMMPKSNHVTTCNGYHVHHKTNQTTTDVDACGTLLSRNATKTKKRLWRSGQRRRSSRRKTKKEAIRVTTLIYTKGRPNKDEEERFLHMSSTCTKVVGIART